ncbi:lipase family alpha/beta hydrolase [Bacillus yunxiaonensis]|uniref:lipase family alpha/beta hydrolase n=1 Tax=Bacillus yunxiaonensis TaxID=3127665 RepID=UPI0039B78DEB
MLHKFKRSLALLTVFIFAFCSFHISSVFASSVQISGGIFPPSESFTPGSWFLGATPEHAENKPPIVFVQGKNGTAKDWYGETVYHGMNDMYNYAYNAGYQTVFIQLYDAAGKGSASEWDNGRLLASMLEQIYNRFGKKVNIVAHSKGGPDTQAALIHYGASRFVGNVVTLASPHYGSNLADLAYSWWAGWLASLLGQRDDGTHSLQTGEMAQFRNITDSNPNAKLNHYYTVAGTSWGPAFSALSMGGFYLSWYGPNDGLVNEWSAKLPYGTHLFTDSSLDHDSIRKGSAVFSRIEPYLRNTSAIASIANENIFEESQKNLAVNANQTVLGGSLTPNNWVEQTFAIDTVTDGNISVLTASPDVQIQLIAPSGKVYTNQSSKATMGEEYAYFNGATIRTFQVDQMEVGEWRLKMMSQARKDAYLMLANYKQDAPFTLDMPGKVKKNKAEFKLKQSAKHSQRQDNISFDVRVVDRDGNLVSHSNKLQKTDTITFTGNLPDVAKSGVYNMTIDIKGKNKEGKAYNRTIVRSVYIEK